MIKHHNFFKVHLPKKEYKGKDENELAEILMEEFYLFSEGKWTKDYEPKNPKTDKFEISLYPSIIYAGNKLNYSENEKFQMINDFLDSSFVDYLERFNPLYKCTSFIEYHLYYFKGNKTEFYKHIKYQILSVVKKRKESKKKDFDYESLEQILIDWVNEKMKVKEEKKSILNAENVIINKKSKIKNQSIGNEKEPKESNWNKANVIIALIVGIATIIGIVWGIMN
ncbi:hypothetical protein [Aequorivita marisscotiae]|uniref:Uncharacterized protein n=1 Tax=Aequorivita marisscotiae TaxID=3040348 RepID=A0ABY8KZV2_9FLAO|nr:hypothetical protein [Aequorivita sp. Ant34-E75]WGF93980.1 hypothetical protein QCQ61_07260 [Aequorivita sp. Ant34-E75]WGF94029.1 hypothetical protein QCQ61_07505 [Aequorivita sp. Ant34-E75]